jgi:hypothetical protein
MNTLALYVAVFLTPLVLEQVGLIEHEADREAQGVGYGIGMLLFSAFWSRRWNSVLTPHASQLGVARGAELSAAFLTGMISAAVGLLLASHAIEWPIFQWGLDGNQAGDVFGRAILVLGVAYMLGYGAALSICRYGLKHLGAYFFERRHKGSSPSDGELA